MKRYAWLWSAAVFTVGAVFGQGFGCQGEIDEPPSAKSTGIGGSPTSGGAGQVSTSGGGAGSSSSASGGVSGSSGSNMPGGSGGGSGSTMCPTGQVLCQGACVNLATDAGNCGTCASACAAGQVCQSGACQCAPGF